METTNVYEAFQAPYQGIKLQMQLGIIPRTNNPMQYIYTPEPAWRAQSTLLLPFPPPLPPSRKTPKQPRHRRRCDQNPTNNNKPKDQIPRTPHLLLPNRLAHRPRPPLPPPHILRTLRAEVPPGIKMMHGIPLHEPRRIILGLAPRMRVRIPPRRPAPPIAAVRVETRRRPAERAPPTTQPAGRPRPRVAAALGHARRVAAVAAAVLVEVRVRGCRWVCVDPVVPVVDGPLAFVGENLVGG